MPPNNGNPTPSIQWSTDSPSRLNISPAPDGLSATLTATGASGFQAGYDIHVTVTYDGTPSSPFPVFLNTPFTMVHGGPYNFSTCTAAGYTEPGFVEAAGVSVADLIGQTLLPIDVNETLENPRNFNGSDWFTPPPTATAWTPAHGDWSGNTFTDAILVCGSGFHPNPQAYSLNGTTLESNITQKFWIGTSAHFQGVCVQRDVISEYIDHATYVSLTTPIVNKPDCNQGTVIN